MGFLASTLVLKTAEIGVDIH